MENKKGFTLVELLAVIAILAILVIIALPNVINMYNRAQKETFLTEVKKIHSEAEKKYISSSINGNTVKTINSEDDSKLDMTGEKLQYCINLNNSGKVTSMKVSNHKWIASLEDGKSIEDLTIDDLEDGNLDGYKCTGTSSVPSVYCTYDGELKQGAEYVNGQYTYRYMQEMNINPDATSEDDILILNNMSQDGWSVILTDKSSSNPVTSKVCTYINNKPVVSMAAMFFMSQAESIDLSSINTSNVENMTLMFGYSEATSLDISNFDTSNVSDMSGMFGASKMKSINGLNKISTSNVTNMESMFSEAIIENLNLSNFNTSKVTNMEGMFSGSQATSIDLSNFDTSKVTDMTGMFEGVLVSEIKGLNSFNTSKVTSMIGMFQSSKVKKLDLSSFDTSKVTDMSYMFNDTQVTNLDLSSFDTSKVTTMFAMFRSTKFATIDLSSFDTNKVTDMGDMFRYCENLKTIYISNRFVTNTVTDSTTMFEKATNLIGGNGTKYNSSYTDKTYARIDTASTPGYFTAK